MPPSVSAGWSCDLLIAQNRKAGSMASGPQSAFGGIFSPNLAVLARSRSFMGLLDKVILTACHDISGIIAVQHKQFYFVWQGGKIAVLTMALVVARPVLAGTIVQPSEPDPLLDGGPTDPCAAGVDYAATADTGGQAVVPADIEARGVPLPDSIAVPLGPRPVQNPGRNRAPDRMRNQAGNPVRPSGAPPNPVALGGDSTYIVLDGRKLEPLVNPPPCTSVH